MANTFRTVRDYIVTKLGTITDIQEVSTDPKLDFGGYPAVAVFPSNQQSDYQNTVQNERHYLFIIPVFYEIGDTSVGDAIIALYDLVDQILDLFDQNPTFTGISLPTGKQMIAVEPSISEWGVLPDNKLLQTSITLDVRISSDMQ